MTVEKTALVLDGNQKSALAIVRSLGHSGVKIAVGAERATAMALHSRYPKATFVYESPKLNQQNFYQAVRTAAINLGGLPLIYACSDATLLTLFKYRNELSEVATLVLPEESAVYLAFDKAASYSKAGQLGIRTIPTLLPSSQAELPKLCQNLTHPAVVKTRHSVAWKNGQGVFGTANFVHSYQELETKFIKLLETTGEAPLIQTFIKGEEYGVELLVRQGQVTTETIHHRIRSLSPTGGASVVKETLEEGALTRELRESAYKLAESLDWNGPLMVEYKVENDTQNVYLMELNGH